MAAERDKAKAEPKPKPKPDEGVDTGERWVSVKLNTWQCYKLDLAKHGTEEGAIRALKGEKIHEAVRKKLTGDKDHDTKLIVEATERIDRAFLQANRRITRRPAWEGIAATVFEKEGDS